MRRVFSDQTKTYWKVHMKSLLSVLTLAFGALTFQSCEDYPNGASRGYYHGGYYGNGYGGDRYGGGYYAGGGYYDGGGYYGGGGYDGGYYGPTVVVSSGYRAGTITDTVITTGITAVKTPT